MAISYEDWHKKIDNTLQWRMNHWNGDKAWKRYLALYRGDQWKNSKTGSTFLEPDSDTPRDRITVNVTGSTILLAKSFLYKQDAKFIVKPKRQLSEIEVQQAVINAMLQQETLNYEWGEQDMQFHSKEALLDALIIGHGIVKTGYTDRKPSARNPKTQGDIESKEHIQDGTPFSERINPFRFLFDIENENYRQLDNVNWCAELFARTKEDIINDDSYKDDVVKKIKQGEYEPEYFKSEMTKNNETVLESEGNLCWLYEVWDKKYRKYYVFIKGVEKPLKETDWPYEYLNGFPYQKLDFVPVPNEHYGLGIPAAIEDQQLELNRVRTTMFDHRRRFNRKYQVQQDSVDPTELQKLIKGDTGTIISVRGQNAIRPIEEGKIPADAFSVESVIKADIQELTGVDQLARAGNLPSRTSATEINARQQFFNLKLDDRVADVDEFVMRIGRKTLQHIKSNFNSEKIIQINGPQGDMWVKFNAADIKAEFDITMSTVSAPKIDETADRQQRIQIFQLIMQNLQIIMQSGVQIKFDELMKWVMESFGEKDISRFMPSIANGTIPNGNTQIDPNAQPNTALNLPKENQQAPGIPQVMTPMQLRSQLMGNGSGGGPINNTQVM